MRYRFLLPLCLALIFLGLLLSTLWPAPREMVEIALQIEQPGVLFTRNAIIESPAFLRQGESARLGLRLPPGADETAGVSYPLQARLEIPGIPGRDRTIHETLLAGTGASFSWEITAETAGTYSGKVWLLVGEGQEQHVVLAAPLEWVCVRPLGLPTWLARWGSAAGLAIFLTWAGIALIRRTPRRRC